MGKKTKKKANKKNKVQGANKQFSLLQSLQEYILKYILKYNRLTLFKGLFMVFNQSL